MKLSEIVQFLELVKVNDIAPFWFEFKKSLDVIQQVTSQCPTDLDINVKDLGPALDGVHQSVANFQSDIGYLITQLEKKICELEPEYYVASTRLFEEEMRWETSEYILNRKLKINSDSDSVLRNRIKNYSDWRLPGMILRPGLETHIEDMVPLDPLYVLDNRKELLQPAMSKFTEQYQRRLRPYVIDDQSPTPLAALPDKQFGLIFAYNFLNYKPIEVVTRYLNDFYIKLRPGGVAVFTYNDCDLSGGIFVAEKHFMCYTPAHRVLAVARDLGFEHLNNEKNTINHNWLELKRPGEIVSLRGGQTLAKIMRK